jgi:prepilin-type N-terminal cleavage/methylation domain-containing protein
MAVNNKQSGFSLIELLIATVILAIVVMMSSDLFTIVIAQSGQQTKVAGSGMDSLIALRTLRYDIEHAGFGLPERFQSTDIEYSEADDPDHPAAKDYNDSKKNVPRSIVLGKNAGLNGSDYLVIKSTIVGSTIPGKGNTAQKWTYIIQGSKCEPHQWGSPSADPAKNLTNGDRVIVIKPKLDPNSQNELIMNDAVFFTTYDKDDFPTEFSPQKPGERFIIYGVDPDTDLRRPFSRADYYISRVAGDISPSCAPNTGTLYKATLNQNNDLLTAMPIMDCVADMRVIFRRDTNGDGFADATTDNLAGLTAQQIRESIQEVRVDILAQEGQRDPSYTHTPSMINVGGVNFNLATTIGAGWQNYRWKIYTITVNPKQFQQKG